MRSFCDVQRPNQISQFLDIRAVDLFNGIDIGAERVTGDLCPRSHPAGCATLPDADTQIHDVILVKSGDALN
jgi:hypothetical protein